MKKSLILLSSSMFLTIPIYSIADEHHNCCNNQNTIMYNTTAEKTIQSDNAKVTVNLNATIPASELTNIQSETKNKLDKLTYSNKNWAVNNYSQYKNASDLLNVNITFTNRLDANEINKLTADIHKLNSNGYKYKITNIDYKPTLQQIEDAKSKLRIAMLTQANKNTNELNNELKQNYHVENISFDINDIDYSRPTPYRAKASNNMVMLARNSDASEEQSNSMQVSTKITLNAQVTLSENK